jgi:drug/metabolite transporter (DMT)-like permease
MADEPEKMKGKSERKILSPGTWFFYSFILWSVIIVPLSMGAFFILEVFPNLFEMGNQYSAMVGLFVGVVISAVVGYFYSIRARDNAE